MFIRAPFTSGEMVRCLKKRFCQRFSNYPGNGLAGTCTHVQITSKAGIGSSNFTNASNAGCRPSTLRPEKNKGTSTQPPKFDSGGIAVGASWKYVALKKGTFAYKCSFHPNM